MKTICTVATTNTDVVVILDDSALLAQLPSNFPFRFRPQRGPHLETTLLGNQPGYSPGYTIEGATLRILRTDLVTAMQKAGTAWPGQIAWRDDTLILTQIAD